MMLRAAGHEWISVSRFIFNFRRNNSVFITRDEKRKKNMILYIKEGAIQYFSLAMIGYTLLVFLMACSLKKDHRSCDSIWHVDGVNDVGNDETISTCCE